MQILLVQRRIRRCAIRIFVVDLTRYITHMGLILNTKTANET